MNAGKGANKLGRPKSPCYMCTEREVKCHGRCGRYAAYREAMDRYSEEQAVVLPDKPVRKFRSNEKRLSRPAG